MGNLNKEKNYFCRFELHAIRTGVRAYTYATPLHLIRVHWSGFFFMFPKLKGTRYHSDKVHTGLAWNLKMQLCNSLVRPTVHTDPSRKSVELFENSLQTGGIWKFRLCVLAWTENILKTELSENDDVTIIMWFPRPSFPQTQDQNVRWLLCF